MDDKKTFATAKAEVPASPHTTTHVIADPASGNGRLEAGKGLDAGAAAQLEEMGYKQELTRSLGMVSVLGLSFAIMAVPFGTSTTLNIALTDGGPVTILYGVSSHKSVGVGSD